jgi:2-polyprenyl-3-methyl-5-hydroxy-6-metoxy-1,4-benzoquinol methylase
VIHVRCNLCGADDFSVRFPSTLNGSNALNVDAFRCTSDTYGHHAQIVTCRECGYVYANPRWDSADVLAAYGDVEDSTYAEEREGRELTFSKHLADMEKRIGPANGRSLLDVGAYIGVFVEVAREAGWNAYGVEPSRWAVEVAHKRGLPVIEGTQDADALQGMQFDVVTLWDVIEHVDDPADEIRKAYQLLKPGGTIVVHTMDIDSLMSRLMQGRWPWLMDMHIHYFSQQTLQAMLRQAGFTINWSGAQGRYLRLGYLATRVGGLNAALGRATARLVERLDLAGVAVPINFGDLFTVYAIRPKR